MLQQLVEIAQEEFEKYCEEVDSLNKQIEEANWEKGKKDFLEHAILRLTRFVPVHLDTDIILKSKRPLPQNDQQTEDSH
ncbi:hypothetical protein NDU88_001988 [Pleurodeles waltl]|uniref:Uncharacterized protein n=1 Tax=Pleurodeles waltl TaxID=8319 RepID=A0AAV7P8P8_PLEWA|nr:hypothetical protein NDU88_001988 [Pleurodeles waltl]